MRCPISGSCSFSEKSILIFGGIKIQISQLSNSGHQYHRTKFYLEVSFAKKRLPTNRMNQILEYIDEHYMENITLK